MLILMEKKVKFMHSVCMFSMSFLKAPPWGWSWYYNITHKHSMLKYKACYIQLNANGKNRGARKELSVAREVA